MCRNIRPLFNFDPPVTDDEVQAASLQFVRKISGFTRPSKANEAAFDQAVDEVADAARRLVDSLVTSAPARDRDVEAAKAKARAAERYAREASSRCCACSNACRTWGAPSRSGRSSFRTRPVRILITANRSPTSIDCTSR